ncbi:MULTISPECIES: DUF1801 domain-containing protein [Arthrobacter]|uniref:DUF1801 domain-containing protein n=2 Tax=Arthrobacter TaxID=1663 RepID=A0ABU9KQS4_9MICC|nr:DUF1801 domain-containing protein [Arthrobacter sp. YJM1]MDP5228205.1 DUF1801 domain-containing protein [Arthrobacter sp. YJM1]
MIFGKKGDDAALAKLREAPAPYGGIGERLHALIRENAPGLEPVVRWGLPFYVKDGEDICYIKTGKDYLAFGFGESVNPAFQEGANLHPIVWNITALDADTEATLADLIRKAAG